MSVLFLFFLGFLVTYFLALAIKKKIIKVSISREKKIIFFTDKAKAKLFLIFQKGKILVLLTSITIFSYFCLIFCILFYYLFIKKVKKCYQNVE